MNLKYHPLQSSEIILAICVILEFNCWSRKIRAMMARVDMEFYFGCLNWLLESERSERVRCRVKLKIKESTIPAWKSHSGLALRLKMEKCFESWLQNSNSLNLSLLIEEKFQINGKIGLWQIFRVVDFRSHPLEMLLSKPLNT